MNKFIGFQRDNEDILKSAYLDGYLFGDRQMEGVMFKFTVCDDGSLDVELDPASESYCKGLNMKYWFKVALEYAEETDVFQETAKGGEDVVLLSDFVFGEDPY